MRAFCSWEVAQKANKWSGANLTRWRSDEYGRLWRAAETEMDPARRAARFIRMNDLVVQDVAVIPVFVRHAVFAVAERRPRIRLQFVQRPPVAPRLLVLGGVSR